MERWSEYANTIDNSNQTEFCIANWKIKTELFEIGSIFLNIEIEYIIGFFIVMHISLIVNYVRKIHTPI